MVMMMILLMIGSIDGYDGDDDVNGDDDNGKC